MEQLSFSDPSLSLSEFSCLLLCRFPCLFPYCVGASSLLIWRLMDLKLHTCDMKIDVVYPWRSWTIFYFAGFSTLRLLRHILTACLYQADLYYTTSVWLGFCCSLGLDLLAYHLSDHMILCRKWILTQKLSSLWLLICLFWTWARLIRQSPINMSSFFFH